MDVKEDNENYNLYIAVNCIEELSHIILDCLNDNDFERIPQFVKRIEEEVIDLKKELDRKVD